MAPANKAHALQALDAIEAVLLSIAAGDDYVHTVRAVERRAVDPEELYADGKLPAVVLIGLDRKESDGRGNGRKYIDLNVGAAVVFRAESDPQAETEELLADVERAIGNNIQPVAATGTLHLVTVTEAVPWQYGAESDIHGANMIIRVQYAHVWGDPRTLSP